MCLGTMLVMSLMYPRVHLKYLRMQAMILKGKMPRGEDEVKDTYKGGLLFKFRLGEV